MCFRVAPNELLVAQSCGCYISIANSLWMRSIRDKEQSAPGLSLYVRQQKHLPDEMLSS